MDGGCSWQWRAIRTLPGGKKREYIRFGEKRVEMTPTPVIFFFLEQSVLDDNCCLYSVFVDQPQDACWIQGTLSSEVIGPSVAPHPFGRLTALQDVTP